MLTEAAAAFAVLTVVDALLTVDERVIGVNELVWGRGRFRLDILLVDGVTLRRRVFVTGEVGCETDWFKDLTEIAGEAGGAGEGVVAAVTTGACSTISSSGGAVSPLVSVIMTEGAIGEFGLLGRAVLVVLALTNEAVSLISLVSATLIRCASATWLCPELGIGPTDESLECVEAAIDFVRGGSLLPFVFFDTVLPM